MFIQDIDKPSKGQTGKPGSIRHFRANGKLMISGEYLVLSGAKALAMPVKYGQTLKVSTKPHNRPLLHWQSLVKGVNWFKTTFTLTGLPVAQIDDTNKVHTRHIEAVQRILQTAKENNPDFLSKKQHYSVQSNIEFDLNWGLGSSSSLIANIAAWAEVSPYDILFKISKGSGYDLACAQKNNPILYTFRGQTHTPIVSEVDFAPPFASQMFFIYSGKKQSSEKSLQNFNPSAVKPADIKNISDISEKMARSAQISEFMDMMASHEELVAPYLGITPVKKAFFPDFPGAVKSLGAWGGDFLLAVSSTDPSDIFNYFRTKGFYPVIPFGEMKLIQ